MTDDFCVAWNAFNSAIARMSEIAELYADSDEVPGPEELTDFIDAGEDAAAAWSDIVTSGVAESIGTTLRAAHDLRAQPPGPPDAETS